MVGNFGVVQILHREVSVAFDAGFGQMHHRYIAAVFVHHLRPLAGKGETDAPLVFALGFGGFVGNVVAEVNHNRQLGELGKIGLAYFGGCDVAECAGDDGRYFVFREGEVARFDGNNGFDFVGRFDAGIPTDYAALRMCDQHAVADALKQGFQAA